MDNQYIVSKTELLIEVTCVKTNKSNDTDRCI